MLLWRNFGDCPGNVSGLHPISWKTWSKNWVFLKREFCCKTASNLPVFPTLEWAEERVWFWQGGRGDTGQDCLRARMSTLVVTSQVHSNPSTQAGCNQQVLDRTVSEHKWAHWWLRLSTQQSLNTGWLQSAITREMSQSMKEHIGGYVSSTQQPFNTGGLQSAIALNNSTTPPHPHFILATSTVSVPWQQTINTTRWRSPWTPAHKGRLGSAATHPSPAPTLPPCFHPRRDGSFSSHTHSLLSRDKVAAAKGAACNGDHSTSTRHNTLWQTARRKRLGPRPRRKPGSLYY